MGVLADWQIRRDIKIDPFEEGIKRPGKISYGCGAYGYDARLGYKVKLFRSTLQNSTIIDPKNFDDSAFEVVDLSNSEKNYIIIPPHSFILGESMETFDIPRDVLCIVMGKSTYARCGLIVNVTPGEPEWKGKWTIEISNTSPLPAKVYVGEGIMQCIFIRCDGNREAIRDVLLEMEISRTMSVPYSINRLGNLEKDYTCEISYKDKKGKYQNQTGVTNPTSD